MPRSAISTGRRSPRQIEPEPSEPEGHGHAPGRRDPRHLTVGGAPRADRAHRPACGVDGSIAPRSRPSPGRARPSRKERVDDDVGVPELGAEASGPSETSVTLSPARRTLHCPRAPAPADPPHEPRGNPRPGQARRATTKPSLPRYLPADDRDASAAISPARASASTAPRPAFHQQEARHVAVLRRRRSARRISRLSPGITCLAARRGRPTSGASAREDLRHRQARVARGETGATRGFPSSAVRPERRARGCPAPGAPPSPAIAPPSRGRCRASASLFRGEAELQCWAWITAVSAS
jgi:hypothetical protein